MDTVTVELMEWGEPSLEDQGILNGGTRSEERRVQDPLTGRVPPQIQESAPTPSERSRRLRRALAATPKGDPLRRISP